MAAECGPGAYRVKRYRSREAAEINSIWRDLRTSQRRYPQDDALWHVTRFLRGLFFIWVFFSILADFWLEVHLYLIAGLTMLLVQRRFEDYAAEAPAAASTSPPVPAGLNPA